MLWWLVFCAGAFLFLLSLKIFQVLSLKKCIQQFGMREKTLCIAFFHPYCSGGGGGERVLWKIVTALNRLHREGARKFHIIIYSCEDWNEDDKEGAKSAVERILAKADRLFNLGLTTDCTVPVDFVFLKSTRYLDAARYPYFTMLGQSLGSMVVGWEALWRSGAPHLFIDTTGFAFTLPVAKLVFGSRTAAYVHYPTISTDMLRTVAPQFSKEESLDHQPNLVHSRRKWVAKSWIFSSIKLLYYLGYAGLYGLAGAFCDLCMVNSSWTCGHIRRLWLLTRKPHIVFPPCDTTSLQGLALEGREPVILSVGQYRTEKDHPLQVRIMAKLIEKYGHDPQVQKARMVMVGGCRNQEDQERVTSIKNLSIELGVQDNVEVVVNAPYNELRRWLGRSSIGLHTMWNEHFGICVVEYMAAGLLAVAHRSGGPLADIVTPYHHQPTGMLAETLDEYADAIANVLKCKKEADLDVRANARASAHRFSDESFEIIFLNIFSDFLLRHFK